MSLETLPTRSGTFPALANYFNRAGDSWGARHLDDKPGLQT